MKILDTETGRIHEYGTNGHDSLAVSQDGRTLSYYNLQCGDGSKYGAYLFVCDDDKIPAESQTPDAIHCEVYFNIGGWRERPKGKWTDESQESLKCSACGLRVYKPFIGGFPTERTKHYWPNYCAFCGADMRKEGEP